MSITNYEITRNRMRSEFLKYDQEKMIRKFQLFHDDLFLYLEFMKRSYRIDRKTGVVTWSEDGFQKQQVEADFNESMTIYDVLCYSKENCCLSGNFCPIESLRGTIKSSSASSDLGGGMFQAYEKFFAGRPELLQEVLLKFGEKGTLKGDASAILYPFSFLPVTVQFWDADEEFPANLKLMYDENIQDYMHFETIWYMKGHILSRIMEEAKRRTGE